MASKRKIKPKRSSSKKRSNPLCAGCPAYCCKDLTLMITKPRTKEEIELLKWQLQFDTVRVFITNYRWHVVIKGKCMYLDRNNMCKIYKDRPSTCRRHNPPDCERYGDYWDVMIETPEELDAYLSRRKKAKKRRAKQGN